MTLRCEKHRITMTINPTTGERKWSVASNRGSGSTLCALLLHPNPTPGQLPLTDENGRPVGAYCHVVEEG